MQNLAQHWNDFNFFIAFAVLISYIIIDGMYAYYTLAVTNKKPFASAVTGSFMHFLIAFGVLNYVQNYLYIFPIAIGSFIGTYYIVQREKTLQNKKLI